MRDLCDIGEGRIAQMDAAGIDMQVVSLTAPGVEQLEAAEAVELARDTNDALGEAIAKQPTRLSGFATLPIAAPDQAAKELERRFSDQTFAGAVINGHQRGRYLDDKFFWPVLEAAESLGAPIYLHPTNPPKPVIEASFGGFAPLVTEMLAGPGFGWHIETAVHVLRMVLGGVFDRFPKLQIVIGHMGEGLPFFMQRVDVISVERRNSNVRSARICATICTTPSPALIFRRHFSICCSRSESAASCSRPTILTAQWPRHARFWNRFRFPPPTVRGSLMVTRRVCSDFERYKPRGITVAIAVISGNSGEETLSRESSTGS